MVQAIIKDLDKNLKCDGTIIKDTQIILRISSSQQSVCCPFCGQPSKKIHSRYQREIQDIPIQEKQTILLLEVRKMFCLNNVCERTTFAETFDFVPPKGKKTERLIHKILLASTKMSSVSAVKLLKADSIKTCKSSICDLLKKNASHCG